MKPPQDRTRYRPSGRLEPAPLLAAAGLAAGVAVLAGYVLHLCSNLAFPGAAMGPLIASLPVAGFVALAVRLGKCRNPLVGAMLGYFCGVVVFVAAFQSSLAEAKGNDHLFRLDLLPEYLDEHVNDNARWGTGGRNRPAVARPATPGEVAFHWGVLAFGCLVGAGLPALCGWLTGASPFSESHDRWLKSWTGRATRNSGPAVSDALYWRRTEELREAIEPIPSGEKPDQTVGFTQVVVEYLPGEADTPVYLTVVVIIPGKKNSWPETLVRRWELTREEADAIADALPVPGALFGTRRGKLEGEKADTLIAARVSSLPDQDTGLVLARGSIYVATAIGLTPLFLGLGGAAGAGVCAAVYSDALDPLELGLVVAGGVISLVASLAWMVLYGDYLPSRYFHAKCRRVVAQRPDPIVDPDNPDARFVQLIPRPNWGRFMLENASDVGFLLLAPARGVILFEGDLERWVIPREAVVSCELESFDVGPSAPDGGLPAFWLVVLKANVGGKVWEAPLAMRPVTFHKQTARVRRRGAEELQSAIRDVLGPEAGAE